MFATPAFAQAAGGAGGGLLNSMLVPMLLVFAIMYFFMIRPQQKKMKEHQTMLGALRRNDKVITQGGIVGKVTNVKDETEVEVEIAEGVKVRIIRTTITKVISKTEPVES
ncbi:preprotein translocase subunit YajC [Aliiroseovarius lamellibrachiae]|uniref:preprotein translocase subunit YajC n=1 Tax=Aliiroseovarius lamellibrachiae TaxID=1924933 RepID=UPI001BE0F05E|nr:preprotein translocase subunit YajC [Aliiroseovarius lamellibrachiae]MBT2130703.1 preprotein translocase subunit YajC [Aliiroseovarius lamellibrachiae]